MSPVLITTMSKDMVEQLKLSHKVVHLVNRAITKICVTLLQYSVDKPETFHFQIRLFAKKKEHGKFRQILYVNYEIEEIIYLLDATKSVHDEAITNPPNVQSYKN